MMTKALCLVAMLLSFAACSSTASEPSAGDAFATEDELSRASEDVSWKEFLGVWESIAQDVPARGRLPPEHMVRKLEFKSDRDDTSRYTRRRMIEVVRPDCRSCTDETFEEGTYRSVAASPSELRRGKLYTTEGGNTTSRDYYEISEDGQTLTLKGTMGDGSRVTRVLRKQR